MPRIFDNIDSSVKTPSGPAISGQDTICGRTTGRRTTTGSGQCSKSDAVRGFYEQSKVAREPPMHYPPPAATAMLHLPTGRGSGYTIR